jgi:hypothetical protein
MPQLRQGDRPYFLNLGAGKVLTISADAQSSGVLRTYPMSAGSESTGQSLIPAGGVTSVGPFLAPTRYAVEVFTGWLQIDVAASSQAAGGGGGALAVQQSDSVVSSSASTLNFTGPLKAAQGSGKVDLALSAQAVLPTPAVPGIPALNDYLPLMPPKAMAIDVGGYPRRRNLHSWYSTADVNFRLAAGAASVSDDYSDPIVGEPYNAANAANSNLPTNGRGLRIGWGAGGIGVVGAKAILPAAVDVSGKNVYLQFKLLTGVATSLGLTVRLFSTGSPSGTAQGADYHIGEYSLQNTANIPPGQWLTLALPIEAFTATGTGATLTAITHIYVAVNGASAGSLLLGDVFCCPRVLQRGVVTIGFDDCRADTWTDAARYMRKYGMPGILYPGAVAANIRQNLDQYQMSLAQMQHLQDRYGWQIAAQAWDTENPDTDFPGETIQQFSAKMSALTALYQSQGWRGGGDGSFFSNVSKGGTRDLAFYKAFRTMRSYAIKSAGVTPSVSPECVPIADPMNLIAFGMDTTIHTVALTSALVDRAIAQKGVARFIFHGVTVNTANFTGLIDYIAAKQADGTLDVMTEDQLIFTARARAFG